MEEARVSKKQKLDDGSDSSIGTKGKSTSGDDKAAAVPPECPEDALTMLARIRQERADRLTAAALAAAASDAEAAGDGLRQEHYDLEMRLQMVRGLLATNEEIWDRCTGRSVTTLKNFHDVDGKPFFTRFIHRKVTIDHKYSSSSITRKDTTFSVSVEYERMMAGDKLPTRLPEVLEALIAVPHMDNGFPDYQRCFDNALALQDDMLVPFLALFRKHLEGVQVAWKGRRMAKRSPRKQGFYHERPESRSQRCRSNWLPTWQHIYSQLRN